MCSNRLASSSSEDDSATMTNAPPSVGMVDGPQSGQSPGRGISCLDLSMMNLEPSQHQHATGGHQWKSARAVLRKETSETTDSTASSSFSSWSYVSQERTTVSKEQVEPSRPRPSTGLKRCLGSSTLTRSRTFSCLQTMSSSGFESVTSYGVLAEASALQSSLRTREAGLACSNHRPLRDHQFLGHNGSAGTMSYDIRTDEGCYGHYFYDEEDYGRSGEQDGWGHFAMEVDSMGDIHDAQDGGLHLSCVNRFDHGSNHTNAVSFASNFISR
jgi:hypothetical protein